MATIKAVKKKTSSKGGLKKSIDYIENPEKTLDGKLIDGYNCMPENAYKEFITIKELRENESGVMAHHFTQNFDPKDNINPEKALELGRELAEEIFKGHQVIISTHIDKEHIHNHLIVNSVNYETGLKLRNNNRLLEQMKSYSDKQCERENLHVIDRSKPKSKEFDYGIYDKNKYEVITRAIKGERKSYIYDVANTVDKNIKLSNSKEEFIKNMETEGYKVKWEDTRKNITYEDKEGNKVRSSNLEKTFNEEQFNKEEMLKTFERNKLLQQQPQQPINEHETREKPLEIDDQEVRKIQRNEGLSRVDEVTAQSEEAGLYDKSKSNEYSGIKDIQDNKNIQERINVLDKNITELKAELTKTNENIIKLQKKNGGYVKVENYLKEYNKHLPLYKDYESKSNLFKAKDKFYKNNESNMMIFKNAKEKLEASGINPNINNEKLKDLIKDNRDKIKTLSDSAKAIDKKIDNLNKEKMNIDKTLNQEKNIPKIKEHDHSR